MKQRPIPDELVALMAEKFRTLGDSTRLAILHSLMNGGEMNVGQVVNATGRSLPNVSKHLKQLADADMVTRRKEGSFALYRLDDPVLEKICALVCDALQRELRSQLKRSHRLLTPKRRA